MIEFASFSSYSFFSFSHQLAQSGDRPCHCFVFPLIPVLFFVLTDGGSILHHDVDDRLLLPCGPAIPIHLLRGGRVAGV